MFTGIVEEIGKVVKIEGKKSLTVLSVSAKKVLARLKVGDSVAVDGVCLTVTRKTPTQLIFDLMRETLKATTLGRVRPGTKVNLERALRVGDRLSGHFVTGHVDAIGRIEGKITRANYVELRIDLKKDLKKYLVPKGSVCLNGVSLTVGEVKQNWFSVYLIPFTNKVTTLGSKKKRDLVNLETDVLAKYVLNK